MSGNAKRERDAGRRDATRVNLKDRRRRQRVAQTRDLIAALFPLAIAGRGENKRPLKIGVGNDMLLACPELDRIALALALTDYTRGPTYLRNVVAGAPRIGLTGEAAGVVTAQEAAYAARLMKVFVASESVASESVASESVASESGGPTG